MRDLRFLREIRVSDPEIGPRSVRAEIALVPHRGAATTVPIRFAYDANVLDDTPLPRAWARVLVAIPPLNYGLFARTIELEYPLAGTDRAWLRSSLDVAAREQLLNRIVSENPLIRSEFRITEEAFDPASVKAVATIRAKPDRKAPPRAPSTDPAADAVLSSGGKESLATYGLLREVGRRVVPVFVNESGRHWHTALTSYRHLVPHGARRVWTDVDRFYAAANRTLPLVRPDFQRVRADTYPIQLFTFHVYQLAALPVLWSDGIGNLWMGNEFDEGPWPVVKGVRHWNGIYDQSQAFDVRASAFYAAKGWNVRQASVVRSLSGPLIEDLLAHRYPDLFATQTSCHATTIRAGKVLPCGTCSKCVGVLLFLLAAGADPRKIRYRADHVERLPEAVATTQLKLDRGEAEHALGRLVQRGWTFRGSANGFVPRVVPEVGALRFDPEMSRLDNLPPDLGPVVYPILLSRAAGALLRKGSRWEPLPPRFWERASGRRVSSAGGRGRRARNRPAC